MENTYVVKPNDTLNQIANTYGYNDYKDAGITGYSSGNPNLIKPGEVLSLKGKKINNPTVVTSENAKKTTDAMVAEANKPSGVSIGQNTFTTTIDTGDLDSDIKSVTDNINNIMAGNLSLTADERLMLDGVRQTYTKARALQEDFNKRVNGGQLVVEARTGRSRYAPEIAMANINKRMQDGLDKVSEINLEEQISLAKMRTDIQDRKLKNANDQFDNLRALRKDRRDEIMDMNNFMLDVTREQRMQMNDSLDRQMKNITLANKKKEEGLDVLTMNDARRYDLPESLIGKTKQDIIKDLQVTKPPQWFIQSQIKAGKLPSGSTTTDAAAIDTWKIFSKEDPDIKILVSGTNTSSGPF